jgi:steroid 5-alpha reductase family enzyme
MYALAFTLGGVVVFCLRDAVPALLNVFIGTCAATVVIFIFNLIFKNASVYDPYWSVQPPFLVAAFYALGRGVFEPAQLLTLIPLLLWAVRLTANWAAGFENFAWQDWRYTRYKTRYPRISELIIFTGIMLMPTCLVYAGSIPLWFLVETPRLKPLFPAIGGAIILTGVILEYIADSQMRAYKRDPNRAPCIYSGLWKHSRHPNYLGELLVWIGVCVSALQTPRAILFPGAILMILLFRFISVPLMESHILEKSPLYAEYKQKVPRIF